MSIRIERCSVEDGPTLTLVGHAAFKNDNLNKTGLPDNLTEEQEMQYIAWRAKAYAQRFAGPDRHYFKAIDDASDKVVGFAGWFGPVPASESPPETRWPNMPEFLNKAHYDLLDVTFKETRKQVMGDRDDYWVLQSLAVHPDFQGRGVAGKLVQHACDNLIDKEGRACYLESSPAGRRLYSKHGFEIKAEMPFVDGKYVSAAMVREARPKVNGVAS